MSSLSLSEKIAVAILQHGPAPEHVLFMPDGHRRFCKRTGMDLEQSYKSTLQKWFQFVEALVYLGVRRVTLIYITTGNLDRPKHEISAFMDPVTQFDFEGFSNRLGISFQYRGNTSLLSNECRRFLDNAVYSSQEHQRAVFEIGIAYDGKSHMVQHIRSVVEKNCCQSVPTDPNDTTNDLSRVVEKLSRDLENPHNNGTPENQREDNFDIPIPPADLLIRTAVTRASNCFMWEMTDCPFLDYYPGLTWPEITLWHILYSVLKWRNLNAQGFAGA